LYNYIILKNENVNKNLKTFVDVDGLLMLAKWWKFTIKKNLVPSLIFIFKFQKNWIWL
jgi:hypothetical protein